MYILIILNDQIMFLIWWNKYSIKQVSYAKHSLCESIKTIYLYNSVITWVCYAEIVVRGLTNSTRPERECTMCQNLHYYFGMTHSNHIVTLYNYYPALCHCFCYVADVNISFEHFDDLFILFRRCSSSDRLRVFFFLIGVVW